MTDSEPPAKIPKRFSLTQGVIGMALSAAAAFGVARADFMHVAADVDEMKEEVKALQLTSAAETAALAEWRDSVDDRFEMLNDAIEKNTKAVESLRETIMQGGR